MKYFLKIFISCISIFLIVSCASMQVHGVNAVQRAISATDLLLKSKISDSYIKVYSIELAQAEKEITDMISAAHSNEMGYVAIADTIPTWIELYDKIGKLEDLYPNGLYGKNEFVMFKTIDYTSLAKDAPRRATEALYAKAQNINTSANTIEERLTALDYLAEAKKYSNSLNKKIHALGADICYTSANALSVSNNAKTLLWAIDLYAQSNDWIPNYKNAQQKIPELKKKAVSLYLASGDDQITENNYSAFRNAKKLYEKAEDIIPNIATSQLVAVNKLLTIKLLILFSGPNLNYPNSKDIISELQRTVQYNSNGPEIVEINFMHIAGTQDFLFANTSGADLILISATDFGTVSENIESPIINKRKVYKAIDGIMYEGAIVENIQTVTVYFKNNVVLYDKRGDWNTFTNTFTNQNYGDDRYNDFNQFGKYTFNREDQKTTKRFISRTYEGDTEANPGFDTGTTYIIGEYAVFFPDFHQAADAQIPITENFGRLNTLGTKLCALIETLQYKN